MIDTQRTRGLVRTMALFLFAAGIAMGTSITPLLATPAGSAIPSTGPALPTVAATGMLGASLTVSPSQVQEGQSIQVQTTANGGTVPYTYAYSGLPSGCTGPSMASFSCAPSSTGTFSIQVTVTDTNGNHTQSNSVSVDVTSSSNNGNGNGSGNGKNGGNNSSNPLSSLFSGFSGLLPLLLLFGVVGFVTWILLLVGVWIIAITLVRRLPKRGTVGAPGPTTKCAACSASISAGSKFCSECGAGTGPKVP